MRIECSPRPLCYLDVLNADGLLVKTLQCGYFNLLSYGELLRSTHAKLGRIKFEVISSDVSELIADPRNAGATFQVTTMFNCLEPTNWRRDPLESGVTRYEDDYSQGPTASISVGGGTLLRHYFVDTAHGPPHAANADRNVLKSIEHRNMQINGFRGMQLMLLERGFSDVSVLNGYLLIGSLKTLRGITAWLRSIDPNIRSRFLRSLRVGVLENASPTSVQRGQTLVNVEHTVHQVFCANVSLYIQPYPEDAWQELATIIAQGGFDCTLATAANPFGNGPRSRQVYLTLVGTGICGVPRAWVLDGLRDSLRDSLSFHPFSLSSLATYAFLFLIASCLYSFANVVFFLHVFFSDLTSRCTCSPGLGCQARHVQQFSSRKRGIAGCYGS